MTDAAETERIVVISSDSAVLRSIWSLGESNCWQLEITGNAWEAMDKVQSGMRLGLVLLDLPYGNGDGLHIVRWLRRLRPGLPIVVIGHPGDNGRKQELICMGVTEYLIRPLDERQLELVIQREFSESTNATVIDKLSDDVETVSNYGSPGNSRELEGSVNRYLMVADKESALEKDHSNSQAAVRTAPPEKPRNVNQLPPPHMQSGSDVSDSRTLRSMVQRVKSDAERNAIAAALQRTGWNRKAAARLLKVSYRSVLYKIAEYRITPSNPALYSEGHGRRREDIAIRDNLRTEPSDLGSTPLRQTRQESI